MESRPDDIVDAGERVIEPIPVVADLRDVLEVLPGVVPDSCV